MPEKESKEHVLAEITQLLPELTYGGHSVAKMINQAAELRYATKDEPGWVIDNDWELGRFVIELKKNPRVLRLGINAPNLDLGNSFRVAGLNFCYQFGRSGLLGNIRNQVSFILICSREN